jgi:TolB protein
MWDTETSMTGPVRATLLIAGLVALTTAGGCETLQEVGTTRTVAPTTPVETIGDAPIVEIAAEPSAAQPPVANDGVSVVENTGYGIPFLTDEGGSGVTFTGDGRDLPARDPVTVGLYGEMTGRATPGGRFDGAGNLMQVTAADEGANFDPDVDTTGALIAFASTQHQRTADIYLMSRGGRTMTQITSDPADDVMPAFAPDSHRIAFASNRGGSWDIYYSDIDGDPPVQITFDADHELHPTWSPDGTTLAYCKLGAQSGRWEIWVVDVARSGAPRFLEYGLFPDWNPDPARNKILFQRARARGSRLFGIWTVDYVNGEALHPTEIVSAANAATMHPAWSPDGTRIVFVSVIEPDDVFGDRPRQADVWVINLDGSGRSNLTNGKFLNLYPAWAPDGVYFLSDRSGSDNIWAVTTNRSAGPETDTGLATADPALEQSGDSP